MSHRAPRRPGPLDLDGTVAESAPTRRIYMVREEPRRFPGLGREIDGWLVYPDPTTDGERRPAILVIHEIFGPDAHILEIGRRFARLGYVVAVPDLFTGEMRRILTPENIGLAIRSLANAPPDLRKDPSKFAEFAATQPPERQPVLEAFGRVTSATALEGFTRELEGVATTVRALPEVDPNRIAAVGFCFGGTMVARLATADPELAAGVIFYGQNPPMDRVPRIRARLLGLYGSEDPGITQTVPDLATAIQSAGGSFDFHVYPGAKHAFFNDTRPNYHEPSARDAWDRVVQFLSDTLG